MAENLSVQALRLAHIFLISLLPWRTWADPSFVCPDFVANHGLSRLAVPVVALRRPNELF